MQSPLNDSNVEKENLWEKIKVLLLTYRKKVDGELCGL